MQTEELTVTTYPDCFMLSIFFVLKHFSRSLLLLLPFLMGLPLVEM